MYIHLGGGAVVATNDVVAILDLDNTGASWRTREFLRRAEQEGRVISTTEDLPKSCVVSKRAGVSTVWLSQMSAATLLRRAESNIFE